MTRLSCQAKGFAIVALPIQDFAATFAGPARCRPSVSAAARIGLLVALTIVGGFAGCQTSWLGSGASSADRATDAPPWTPPSTARTAQLPAARPATPAPSITRTIAKSEPLSDPRWIQVLDESLDPLAPSAIDGLATASSAPSTGQSLNERLRPHWHPATRNSDSDEPAPPPDLSHRWRHPGLERLLVRSAELQPDLHLALADRDPVVRTNAAILLARRHDSSAYLPLFQAIQEKDTNNFQRLAAVEAFAECRFVPNVSPAPPNAVDALRRLIDEHGRFSGDAANSYDADFHAELLHSLAVAEATYNPITMGLESEPRFAAALDSPAADVRREALLELCNPRSGALPANVVRYVGDSDSAVRRAALLALTVRRHPESLELLHQALQDQDLLVRLCAIGDLGRLGGPGAADELHQFTSSKAEVVRAAAATALIRLGDEQIVSLAEADKSWHVRRTLVPLLDRSQDPRPAALAERLVEDSNFEVARPAIEVVGHWPLTDAGPILLKALDSRGYQTRKSAAQQLTKLWPPAAEFETEAIAPRRAAQIADLRQKWQSQMASGAQAAAAPIVADKSALASYAPTEQQRADVEHLLSSFEQPATIAERAGVLRQLISIGPVLPKILCRKSPNRPAGRCQTLSITKSCRPSIRRLRRSSGFRRTICASGAARPTRLPAKRVRQRRPVWKARWAISRHRPGCVNLTIRESDPLVWSSVLAALADESRGPATQLAYAGLSHPSPEVRRLACEHLGAHPDARHGPLLSKSLTDPNPPVVEAAIRAIGRLPSFDSPRPLEAILDTPDHTLRVEAAESLATLGYSSGTAALERLAYDPATQVRRLAAVAMGRVGDRSFVPALVRLLDDRAEIARAALAGLPRAAGHDLPPAGSAAGAAQQSVEQASWQLPAAGADSQQEQIRRWKQWYAAGPAAR